MKALKVFSESLRFMKDHALKNIAEHTSGKKFITSDATWVLIVPATWGTSVKQFMKEVAKEVWLKIFMLWATGQGCGKFRINQ